MCKRRAWCLVSQKTLGAVPSLPGWSQLPWSKGSLPREAGVHKDIHAFLLKLILKPTLATLPHPHIQSAPNLALVHPEPVRYNRQ